jgi:two-component sensor histidine kinase
LINHLTAERLRAWLPATGSIAAYAFGFAVAAAGVLAHFLLDQIAHEALPPYVTMYPVIVISAFAGGMRVGVFTVVVSAAAAWALWIGPQAGEPASAARITIAIVYIVNAMIVVLACGFARLLLDEVVADHAARERATRESVHRIKNLIAVVQSLSRKISRSVESVGAYRDRLDARLSALAVAQDMLLRRDWAAVTVREVVQATLAPFLSNPRLEVSIADEILAPTQAAAPLSLALYELATNSMKYGALASPQGYVRLEARAEGARATLDWRETGLASPAAEDNPGLGSTLIRSALQSTPESFVVYQVGPQTVSCVFAWPLPEAPKR